MKRSCQLPLDSYRLAQYAVQVPCFICEGGNAHDDELCRHCLAPMALSHQAAQNIQPQMIAVLGASGAGKTVYLGMLMDMLSRQVHGIQALARGAFSISLQQTTTAALAQCDFPDKTPGEPDRWNWVHCQVRSQQHRRSLELVVPDMAGESILEEVDHPHTFPVIRSFLQKCAGVLILIDAARLENGDPTQDHMTMKLLTFLCEVPPSVTKRRRRKHKAAARPVGLVLSKADQCEHCFDDASGFARTHASGMWTYCQEHFKQAQFFASGVAGSCAFRQVLGDNRRRIPLRIEPRGIVEPFAWLISKIPARKK